MRFADFPFLRYLPFILIGILWSQSSWSPDLLALSVTLGILWISYLVLISNQKNHKPRIQPSSLAYIALLFLGAVLVQNKQHQTDVSTEILQAESYLAEVTLYDQQKPNSFENLLEVKSVLTDGEWDDAQGKVFVYHQSEKPLKPGQMILVRKKPEEIASPRNPYEFDYRLYLSRQGIHYRQFLGKDFQVIDSVSNREFDYFLVHLRYRIG